MALPACLGCLWQGVLVNELSITSWQMFCKNNLIKLFILNCAFFVASLCILKAVKNWCFCHRFKRWLTVQWIWSSSVKINTRLSGTADEICAVATDVSEGNAASVVPIFVLSWRRDASFLEGTWVTSSEFLSCGISSQSACILFYLYIVSHLWFLWTWFPGGRASFDSQPILRSSVILFYFMLRSTG